MVFPVVMYRCESWTIKMAEQWGIDAFELWYWSWLLRVPWTTRRSNQSILKEINPEYSLEGLMLKLKLQYFGHLMQRANSLEKILMLEKIEARAEGGDRGWDCWMASLTQWTWIWANSGRLSTCMLGNSGRQRAWCAIVHGVAGSRTWLSHWTIAEIGHPELVSNKRIVSHH